MRDVTGIEDEMRGVSRFQLDNGDLISFDARTLREVGLEEMMKHVGLYVSKRRVEVRQSGLRVGSVPWTFHPRSTKSRSMFYDIRATDFKQVPDGRYGETGGHLDYHWEACPSICSGDFEAIPGFVWDREAPPKLERAEESSSVGISRKRNELNN